MINKKKVSKLTIELIGYLFISTIIATFSYAFLHYFSLSIAYKSIVNGDYTTDAISNPNFSYLLQIVCIIASSVVFFTFFLLFLGKKISYILSITNGINIFKDGNLSHKIEIYGSDELTDLAETINSFSIALKNHREKEILLIKEKEDLIRSLSHDIRTPLTSIISYTDFIKNKNYHSEECLQNYIDIVQSKAYHIQEISNLLLNNKSTHNKLDVSSIIDGKLMFEQLIYEFDDSLKDNNFETEIDTLGLVSFNTTLHAQDIARIFDNLYSNILKYADNKNKVYLKVFILDNIITICQSNTIHNKNSINIESNNIGLKNIELIIKSYNGYMNISSSKNEYKIEIKLPINL